MPLETSRSEDDSLYEQFIVGLDVLAADLSVVTHLANDSKA